jgi:hypothetical protein
VIGGAKRSFGSIATLRWWSPTLTSQSAPRLRDLEEEYIVQHYEGLDPAILTVSTLGGLWHYFVIVRHRMF